ncbi:MAG: aminopeptidase P family protein [Clostridia bacterium]
MLKLDANEAILFTDYYSRLYFSDFKSSDGYFLITPKEKYLLVDFRYFEAAKKLTNGVIPILTDGKPYKIIKELLQKNNIKRVGLNKKELTLYGYDKITTALLGYDFYDVTTDVENEKIVKTAKEIACIKTAQSITDRAFEHILSYIKPGVCETDIVAELEYFMKKNKSTALAFDTIALTGAKTAMCHGIPDDTKIQNHSFFLLDFGAVFGNYCSDMTRTVAVGSITSEMKRVYDIVLEANNLCEKAIKAGVLGSDIDGIARDFISKSGYEGKFGHSLGHGLGMRCHELPNFSPNYKKHIPKDSVLSVEPGIYLEGEFGVRIEDLVVVTESGIENLTKTPKQLIIL